MSLTQGRSVTGAAPHMEEEEHQDKLTTEEQSVQDEAADEVNDYAEDGEETTDAEDGEDTEDTEDGKEADEDGEEAQEDADGEDGAEAEDAEDGEEADEDGEEAQEDEDGEEAADTEEGDAEDGEEADEDGEETQEDADGEDGAEAEDGADVADGEQAEDGEEDEEADEDEDGEEFEDAEEGEDADENSEDANEAEDGEDVIADSFEELAPDFMTCVNTQIEPLGNFCEDLGLCSDECLGVAAQDIQPALEACCEDLSEVSSVEAIAQCRAHVQSGAVVSEALGCSTASSSSNPFGSISSMGPMLTVPAVAVVLLAIGTLVRRVSNNKPRAASNWQTLG